MRRALNKSVADRKLISGVGRRVGEAGRGLIAGYAFSSPYEDLKLKGK